MDPSENSPAGSATAPEDAPLPTNEPGFAFLYVPETDAELAGGVPDEKFQIAKSVFDDLLRARGDLRLQAPTFVMESREGYVAWMNPGGPDVGLEEKAYDVCASFGDDMRNAIAALMGHELTHYYEKHNWRRHFVSQFSDLEVGKDLGVLDDAKHNEAQADYLGGLLAYSAGYPFLDKMPELCEKLYAAYGLPDKIPGYPSLEERKAISLGAQKRLNELANAFDMANYLVVIGSYQEAFEYYNYLLKEYQTREIFNNAGVCAFLAALEYFDSSEVRFHFPVELDLQGWQRSKGLPEDFKTIRNDLLNESIRLFKAALALDKDYAPAFLNMACAYTLLGDYRRGRFMAEVEAVECAGRTGWKKVLTDVQVLMGIIEARESKEEAAAGYFQAAIEKGSALAAYNLAVLLGKKPPKAASKGAAIMQQEQIDGISLAAFLANPEADDDSEQPINATRTLFSKTWPGKASRMLISMSDNGDRMVLVHRTGPAYDGQTAKGIVLGATYDAITAAYGSPHRIYELTSGQLLAYDHLLFQLDGEGKLKEWATYTVDEL